MLPLVLAVLLAGSTSAQVPDAPLPEGPQLALPSDRLGKDGDCSSACNVSPQPPPRQLISGNVSDRLLVITQVCGCDRETDKDRGGAGSKDLNPDGSAGGGGSLSHGKGAMATEEACCQYCRDVPNAVLYKWESDAGHNCWCSSNKGPITASGPDTHRRSGSFVSRLTCTLHIIQAIYHWLHEVLRSNWSHLKAYVRSTFLPNTCRHIVS